MSGLERRLGVVFHDQLHAFGSIITPDLRLDRKAEIDPCGYAAARDAVTVFHHPFTHSFDIQCFQH